MAITNAHKVILEEKQRLAELFNLAVDHITQLRSAYYAQMSTCQKKLDRNKNKVDMKLTFEEWLKIWVDSGKIHQRGKKLGEYCMCRIDDIGHYEIGNVYIDLASNNSRMAPTHERTPEMREKMRQKYLGKKRSAEMWDRVRQSRLAKGYYKGVYSENDNMSFVSIADAARYYNVHSSTIQYRCSHNKKGFRFA